MLSELLPVIGGVSHWVLFQCFISGRWFDCGMSSCELNLFYMCPCSVPDGRVVAGQKFNEKFTYLTWQMKGKPLMFSGTHIYWSVAILHLTPEFCRVLFLYLIFPISFSFSNLCKDLYSFEHGYYVWILKTVSISTKQAGHFSRKYTLGLFQSINHRQSVPAQPTRNPPSLCMAGWQPVPKPARHGCPAKKMTSFTDKNDSLSVTHPVSLG